MIRWLFPGRLRRSAWAFGLALLASAVNAGAGESPAGAVVRVLVQSSPLAGSQYYRLDELREQIRVGDVLELTREPENRHDANAIRVRWRGHVLGYLPRRENAEVARALDRGEPVRATVERLVADPDPWRRLRIAVYIEL